MTSFSPDFRWASINGAEYSFTSRQAQALEAAKLVEVERHRGRCPLVTLLSVSGSSTA